MATLKLTIFKAKVLKDGRHKIRVAICHKQETCYIVTRFIIDSLSQFKNGQVVKRSDAPIINTKLRSMMNELQERLDGIKNQSLYSCKQIMSALLFRRYSNTELGLSFKLGCPCSKAIVLYDNTLTASPGGSFSNRLIGI